MLASLIEVAFDSEGDGSGPLRRPCSEGTLCEGVLGHARPREQLHHLREVADDRLASRVRPLHLAGERADAPEVGERQLKAIHAVDPAQVRLRQPDLGTSGVGLLEDDVVRAASEI